MIRSQLLLPVESRLGTAAVTARGLKVEDMDKIAEAIALMIQSEDNAPERQGNYSGVDGEISFRGLK